LQWHQRDHHLDEDQSVGDSTSHWRSCWRNSSYSSDHHLTNR
jgi:hypothetical protein